MPSASSSARRPKPFTFERSFDDPSKVYLPGEKYGPKIEVALPKKKKQARQKKDDPPPPPQKTLTEEQYEADLEAARDEGYVKGHTAALEEAETARDHYVADAVNLISKGLSDLQDMQNESNRELGETALRMVYAVVEKVIPAHAREHALESIEELVREVLPLVYEEPKLVVRTHAMIAEATQDKLDEVCKTSNFNGTMTVVPDYELQPGDCRVEWDGGSADRDEQQIWADIRAIVTENLGPVDMFTGDDAAPEASAETAHAEDETIGSGAAAQDETTDVDDGNGDQENGTGDQELQQAADDGGEISEPQQDPETPDA